MSLIKKSDVKNHLSTANTSVYPFGLKRSDTNTATNKAEEAKVPGGDADVTDIHISPSQPNSPEAIPNAQVGGSVGVPVSDKRTGNGSW